MTAKEKKFQKPTNQLHQRRLFGWLAGLSTMWCSQFEMHTQLLNKAKITVNSQGTEMQKQKLAVKYSFDQAIYQNM